MNLFCAYAFTGENLDEVTNRVQLVVGTLNSNGHTPYCNLFDEMVAKLNHDEDM